ncbi:outer membrane lipid asymmetry maintenance protein MlaD [Thiomicrorhabdus sp. 6S2-11]|jgi:phospholipid/cholesterol/gamma-HCH transport system substrate-binding protein|uniref:Outer membrane lipid asymmetry maintenance protein MlaD n=1 Tax=Thiomicrorhabdus marina TaxID=2818442 RepID=A0ABS3Q2W8_9GAMM|nr:outer membrane lipid asymmetry maintenance protein MlaD [Thiomicrorhabdus marina]MBO1926289.1 outer membrane lipid asymmetry maintenance protein MlaD [Thiomicrorhabdus marina]
MKQKTTMEIWVGALVLMTIAALLMIALQVSNFTALKEKPSYQVTALFSNIGGLKVRAPVKLSGVVIGRVTNITIDQKTFKARVWMQIDQQFNELSSDSSAAILTSGLLGDQYVGIAPGGDFEYLENGSEIEYTQSALVLEELIGQFLVKFTEGGDK